MELGDVATWTGSLATAVAVAFAAWQLFLLRREQAGQRQMEISGVVVTWTQQERPRAPEPDGWATWVFEVTVHNPGRMPIRNVEIDVDFPTEVRRLHFDGHLDRPTRTLNLGLPVLAGATTKSWIRTVRMVFAEQQSLRGIVATVSFYAMDGNRYTNSWGAELSSARAHDDTQP